jgi:hypothetical protein
MEIVDVNYIGSDGQYQTYVPSDKSLINSSYITPVFGNPNDYVEYFIKDQAGTILSINYSSTRYKVGNDVNSQTGTTSILYLDPEADARDAGYDRGIVNIKYNFFRTYLDSSPSTQQSFWIKEISNSRTEIKVARQDLSNTQLETAFLNFNADLAADAYYPDFFLNFGLDQQVIAVNAIYVEEDGSGYVLFKLYEPLPSDFDIKSTFWVVTVVADSAEFNVSINVEPEVVQDTFPIKGPNYKVTVNNTAGQTTPYYNYQSLFNTAVTSSYQQLKSMMDEKGININVDYSDFANFTHFSSITERLENFVYKLGLIEDATAGIAGTNTVTAKATLQASIDNIITKFDGYEYYLYYTSASTAWPKRNSSQPYQLYSVTSSEALNWLGSESTMPSSTGMSMYYSSSLYDNLNSDLLQYSMPAYLRDDSSNDPYMTFLNMIGQHFDNIWIYLKDVTNRFSAENNPFVGISMDQVADALRGLGIQLYTNTSISDNIYYSLFGINPDRSLLPPTGSEVITNYVTSSIQTLPGTQITNEYYKRLYHNMAYLLKTRGTERGIRALVTTFGIPNNVLQVHEYGGYDIFSVPGIQEIPKNKIITGSGVAQIQTDLLSPNVTLQYYQNNTMKSSINLEIGFSPADSINASITGSQYVTSSTQPGYFNIMQLIGDPRLQYSSSYEPLVKLSNTFFSASYNDRYNVWDFIRVIKYYNNSLFKMVRDWVPARASATTGIIIKPHMLERSKYARHEPTYTTSSNEAYYELLTVTGSDGGSILGTTTYVQAIPVGYSAYSSPLAQSPGTIFVSSSDDVQKYTGEFSGSTIQGAANYFPQYETSYNPYNLTSQNTKIQLPALFENVSGSPISERFLDLDYNSSQLAPVNYNLILQSLAATVATGSVYQSQQPYSQYAQVQDYNYFSRASIYPRYNGSTLSGLKYNSFSPPSTTWEGDKSYGTEPVINYYTNKLGLFTQVSTSSFLPGKVNVSLAYLADVSGGIFELNQNNKNWQDVQGIIKEGSTVTIKQFDNKKYSNQKSTDGVKSVYNSGYSYTPQLYFRSGSDYLMYFQYVNSGDIQAFVSRNKSTPNSNISGVPSPYYRTWNGLTSGSITNIFDDIETGGEYFTTGSQPGAGSGVFPTYIPTQTSIKSFIGKFTINTAFQNVGESVTYRMEVYKNGTTRLNGYGLSTFKYTSTTNPGTSTSVIYRTTTGILVAGPTGPTVTMYGPFTVYGIVWVVDGAGVLQAMTANPAPLTTTGPVGSTLSSITVQQIQVSLAGTIQTKYAIVARSADLNSYASYFPYYNASSNPSFLYQYTPRVLPSPQLTNSRTLNFGTYPAQINDGDLITFQFFVSSSTANYTASVSHGENSVLSTVNAASQATSGLQSLASAFAAPFLEQITTGSVRSYDLVLNTSLSQFWKYQFVPYLESGSTTFSSSLYTRYGDVNATLDPKPGDAVVMYDSAGTSQTIQVVGQPYITASTLHIPVEPIVLQNWINNPKQITQFLLVKKYADEQNVILTFNKAAGETSYGFLIPDKTNPEVLNKINTLQSAVQTQLIQFQGTTG